MTTITRRRDVFFFNLIGLGIVALVALAFWWCGGSCGPTKGGRRRRRGRPIAGAGVIGSNKLSSMEALPVVLFVIKRP